MIKVGKVSYFKTIQERRKRSKVYRNYQLVGLEISKILRDEKHKSFYIKLAKQSGSEELLGIAKEVAARNTVKNKGAYFTSRLKSLGLFKKFSTQKSSRKGTKQQRLKLKLKR